MTDGQLQVLETVEISYEEQESEMALPFPLLASLSDQGCVQIIATGKAAEIMKARGGQGVNNIVQAMKSVQKEIC